MPDASDMPYEFTPIAWVSSCFKEKFGIPRQPGLAPAARARIELIPPYNDVLAFEGLHGCSHIWLQFVFHRAPAEGWRPRVRPPRLGGNERLGVFATRSTVRPNPIGLSVVRLEAIGQEGERVWLEVSGIDLVDGTPILDIKPYLPYVDRVDDATYALAETPPPQVPVFFRPEAEAQCQEQIARYPVLRELIVQVLQQDPRPSYQQPDPERRYGMKLFDLDIHWHYRISPDDLALEVSAILPVDAPSLPHK